MVIPALRKEFWVDSKSGASAGSLTVKVGRRDDRAFLSISDLSSAYLEPYLTEDRNQIGLVIDGKNNPSIEAVADALEFIAQVLRNEEVEGYLDFGIIE